MAHQFKLNNNLTLDLDRILTVRAVENCVMLTYLDGHIESISPLAQSDINRLLDCWLGMSPAAQFG